LTNKYKKCDNKYKKQTTERKEKMAVSVATYKVGDTYTSQKSKVTGVIKEIVPTNKNTVRVRLDVNGETRWTTWKNK
jgi:transposase